MWCPSYSDLRGGKDIQNDTDLIDYVTKVMKDYMAFKFTSANFMKKKLIVIKQNLMNPFLCGLL